MKAVAHVSMPRPMAYGDSCAGYPVLRTVTVQPTRSSRSAPTRATWLSAAWYSPPMVQSTTPAPMIALNGRVNTTRSGRTPSSAPVRIAQKATGGRNSS